MEETIRPESLKYVVEAVHITLEQETESVVEIRDQVKLTKVCP